MYQVSLKCDLVPHVRSRLEMWLQEYSWVSEIFYITMEISIRKAERQRGFTEDLYCPPLCVHLSRFRLSLVLTHLYILSNKKEKKRNRWYCFYTSALVFLCYTKFLIGDKPKIDAHLGRPVRCRMAVKLFFLLSIKVVSFCNIHTGTKDP